MNERPPDSDSNCTQELQGLVAVTALAWPYDETRPVEHGPEFPNLWDELHADQMLYAVGHDH